MSKSRLCPGDRVRIVTADYDEFREFIGKKATVDHVWSEEDVGLRIDGQPGDVTYSFTERQLDRLT